MKKVLSWIITLAMLLCIGQATFSADTLPKVGDVINGFRVVEKNYEKLFDAENILFVHEKTGAQVLYLATDDINRAFNIGFRTPALDDKGIPHVFEHATLEGSAKYPSQSLFFSLISQTYNTFMNAMTFTNFTVYLLASLSEDQLYLLSDYYLDSVFHPLIYEEERIFNREAWRYELTDSEEPLSLTGTVYNEMRGNSQIETAARFNLLATLYPDSIISNNSGGNPDSIPDMTYEEILDFHNKYYHPSNSLTYIYGDLDYVRFLGLLNEYFSQYEKSEIAIDTGVIEPLTEMVSDVYYFPVEASSSTDGMTIVQYSFAVNNSTMEDLVGLQFLCGILNQESSILKQEMKTKLPKVSFSVSLRMDLPQPCIVFEAQGLDEENKSMFKDIVDNSLRKIVLEGINKEAAEAILSSQKLSNYLTTESSNLGTMISLNYYIMWASHDNLSYFNDFIETAEMIGEEIDNRYFENLMNNYLIGNKHKALVVTVPDPGASEVKTEELLAKLEQVKKSMSSEEINALVNSTKDLANWSLEETPKEMLRSLQAVDVSSLPEEAKEYEITDEKVSDIRLITAEAAAGGIGMTSIYLDASHVKVEDVHYLQLLTALVGNVSTTKHSTSEIATLTTRYLNSFSVSVDAIELEDGDFIPVLSTSWLSLMSEYKMGIDLVKELVFDVDLSNVTEIKSVINRLKMSYRYLLNGSSEQILLLRAYATAHDMYKYYSYVSGIEFYQFLVDAEKQIEEDPASFIARLESVKNSLTNKNGAISTFAGNEESIDIFKDNIGRFFEGFTNVKRMKADYSSIKSPARSEAIVIDSAVQYNVLYASLEDLGIEYDGSFMAISKLIYDSYIIPQIRHRIGAYDSYVLMDDLGIFLMSYRDPGISETYEVYKGIGDFLETASFSQEDVNSYIISSYVSYAMPYGEITGAVNALSQYLEGKNAVDEKLEAMKELKSLTVQDIRAMNDVFDKLYSVGIRSTSGGAAVIEDNKERFLNIINPISQSGEEIFLTRGDLIRLLYGDVPEAIQIAAEMGVIKGDQTGNYREDDLVTRQEFAIIIFRVLGLSDSSSEADISDINDVSVWARGEVTTLVGYGILPLDENGKFLPKDFVTMNYVEDVINQLFYVE